ncbi:XRE family transcriptional regulator [Pseudomonas sp.]|jgi:predicted XRE-type DNA-binding protein|uniref:XRE family transcriptional regulator n=1 Tax=Pseudomonas sp. TaxID=306 RepID=UPI002EDAA3AF
MNKKITTFNVYEDLGFPDSDSMYKKAKIMAKIYDLVRGENLLAYQNSENELLDWSKISTYMNGHFEDASELELINILRELELLSRS